jgi:hypothetical protein
LQSSDFETDFNNRPQLLSIFSEAAESEAALAALYYLKSVVKTA